MISETFDEDYYAILGVRQTATAEQIKRAFRSKAKLLHPDRNRAADANEAFIRLGEAYRVLQDDEQRLVFDAFRATVAPPATMRRPVWRAAAVMVALLVSIGAASTFGYFALSGGPTTVVAESAPAKPLPAASTTASLLPPAGEGGLRVSGGRMRGDAAEGVAAAAASSLIRPPPAAPSRPASGAAGAASTLPTQAPPSSASGRSAPQSPATLTQKDNPRPASAKGSPPLEDDEFLVASLSDSVDAPFAMPRALSVVEADPPMELHAPVAAKAQQASAATVPVQRVDRRPARPQIGAAPKPTVVAAVVASAMPHRLVVRPMVRAYAKPPYPVRSARPYPVRIAYPPYPRASVRHAPPRRYQAPRWTARRALAEDWLF